MAAFLAAIVNRESGTDHTGLMNRFVKRTHNLQTCIGSYAGSSNFGYRDIPDLTERIECQAFFE